MSTASVMQPGPSLAHDRKQARGRNRGLHRTHSTCQTQTKESSTVETESLTDPVSDTLAFNPKSILPTTKSAKNLGHQQKYSDAATSTEMPSERIDGCTLEPNQTNISQSSRSLHSKTDQAPFIAFGVEAYPTRAVFDDICYDFVRNGRWCRNGRKCPRIHPIRKGEYLATVIRESVIYSRMRAKRKEDQALTPFETISKREMDVSCLKSTKSSPNPNISTLLIHDPIRINLPSTVPNIFLDHADTQGKALSMEPYSRPDDGPQARSLYTLPNFNTNAKQQNQMTRLEDVSDSTSSSGDSQLSKKHHDLDEEYDNPWKALRPTWHTNGDEDDIQSDKESGYWSNSNETTTSCLEELTRSTTNSLETPKLAHGSLPSDRFQHHCHPWPKSNELCRNWLRGQCDRGHSCRHIHEDLGYDDSTSVQKDSSGNKTAVVVFRRGPETMLRTLQRHIRVTFAAGFRVAELSTGFESFCIMIGGLLNISDSEVLELVKPFGKVRELRKPIDSTSQMTRVYFEKTSEAFAALIGLQGKKFLGNTLDVKPGNETNGNRLVFKGTSVRFQWDAPCRTVYMGYSTRRLAEQAIDDARSKPCGGFMAVANIHIGIPAVGAVTVRFLYLPVDVDQDKMKIFGPHEGMVTGKPNVTFTMQDMIRGFKQMLKSRRAKITDMDIRGPPYTSGKMTAWVTFANARDAEEAAASLHLSQDFMGGRTISAFHVKTISFSLTPIKYQLVAGEIRAFQDRLAKDDRGYSIMISMRKDFVNIQFAGDEVKVLGRLKAEFERILNGEQLYDNGRVVWHPFLAGPDGREFLDNLQDYSGITIIASPARSSIRLLGDVEKRAFVREKIVSFVNERRAQTKYSLPLGPYVAKTFQQDGLTALEAQLGQRNIFLDLWHNRLVVSGDLDAYTVAKEAVFSFRQKHQLNGPHWKGETCPACTAIASSPVKLPCGHSWCRSCLRHYLKSAAERESLFPLTCHGIGKRCEEPIPLFTAREILIPEDFEAIFQSAFSAHVLTHPEELHYCPTPDCPQIYRSTPEGISMQCPECLSQICTHCHCEAHEGLTCDDGDGLFRDWAVENNVKQCPKCKMAIEKAEGCNHMTCGMCRTHICWVCMQTFENGLKIYGHMQSEHGGSGI